MDPFTVTAAISIVKTLGVDKFFGRLIGGDKGEVVAGKVIDVAQAITGTRNPTEIADKLSADPALAAQLTLRLNELAAEESQRMYADLADARSLQEYTLLHGDKFSRRFIYYMSAFMLGFTFLFMGIASFVPPVDPGNQRTIDMAMTFLMGSCVSPVMIFFYGQHRNASVKKTD